MVEICLYFQVHEPQKIKGYRVYDIGHSEEYFDEEKNKNHILKLARECYIPMNNLILDLINRYDKKLKVSFSISGITLELLETYAPQVIDSFKALSRTGCVEFIGQTYYESLSSLYSQAEFKRQAELHSQIIKKHFEEEPKVFRNTLMIHNNDLSLFIENMGYNKILTEGSHDALGPKSPNHIYSAQNSRKSTSLLFNNKELSKKISDQFPHKEGEISAVEYVDDIANQKGKPQIINITLDYKVFLKTQREVEPARNFFSKFVEEVIKNESISFNTPSGALKKINIYDKIDIPFLISSHNPYSDLESQIANKMQKSALEEVYELEKAIKDTKDKELIINWRKLTTADHFYNMYTDINNIKRKEKDFENPYDGYVYYMNILNDLIIRAKIKEKKLAAQKDILSNKSDKRILSRIKQAVKN